MEVAEERLCELVANKYSYLQKYEIAVYQLSYESR
jgi:hypothetical protein